MFFREPEHVESLPIEALIDHLETVGPLDTDSKIADCVLPLRRVAAGAPMLLRAIALQTLDKFKSEDQFGQISNSFLLYSGRTSFVRLNVWRPVDPARAFNAINSRPYAYDFPHDHDFDLLTVGAFGPGYTTTIFEYAPPNGEICIGQSVDAKIQGDFTLRNGAILFYEQSRDIHVQHPPESLSVSLNIISSQRVTRRTGQFAFDPSCSHIVGVPENAGARVLRLAEMLIETGGAQHIDLIVELYRHFPDDFVGRHIIRWLAKAAAMAPEVVATRLGAPWLAEGIAEGAQFDTMRHIVDG